MPQQSARRFSLVRAFRRESPEGELWKIPGIPCQAREGPHTYVLPYSLSLFNIYKYSHKKISQLLRFIYLLKLDRKLVHLILFCLF